MRQLVFLATLFWSGAAAAQGLASSPQPPATAGPPASFGPVDTGAPDASLYGYGDNAITPTMVRERVNRTERLYARYPGLREQVERKRVERGSVGAQRALDAAAKKARWE